MKISALNSRSVDYLNIGLIFISLLVAFKLPFELFLFSYAVLGPLHYLTEINWLQGKNYFIKERKWVWALVMFAVLMTIPVILKVPNQKVFPSNSLFDYMSRRGADIFYASLFITFVYSISLVYLSKWQHIVLLFIANIVAVLLILKFRLFSLAIITMFLPTIVHVYLFTLLFMIFGAIKTKSMPGFISCLCVIACPFIIGFSHINANDYMITEQVKTTFFKSDFQNLVANIAGIFGSIGDDNEFHLISEIGIKIQIFIAFCYTYHYLNWFSKTTVIGWSKNITKPKFLLLATLWFLSIGLYYYDYRVGFCALFTLSLIHVFFEFPLNIISIHGILSGLREKIAR